MTNHHYFASTGLGWATAETREQAVEKLARCFSGDIKTAIKNAQKNGIPGAYCWSCKVEVPEDTDYKIDFYQPKDVPISDGLHHHITYMTEKKIAFTNEKELAK